MRWKNPFFLWVVMLLLGACGGTTNDRPDAASNDNQGDAQVVQEDAQVHQVSITAHAPVAGSDADPRVFGITLPKYANLTAFYDTFDQTLLRDLGIKFIRFGGNEYDWKNSRIYMSSGGVVTDRVVMSVDDVMDIAADLDAEINWVVHAEPNEVTNHMGWMPLHPGLHDVAANEAVLIQDAVDLVDYTQGAIRHFEIHNEPWGYLEPEYFGELALRFAHAIKDASGETVVGLVGFPTTGNNMSFDPHNDPTNSKASRWMTMVQTLLGDQSCASSSPPALGPCFDYVTDHPYLYTGYSEMAQNYPWNVKGSSAFYPLANFSQIFADRLLDYTGAELANTEWNLKCWKIGDPVSHEWSPLPLVNPSFEDGETGWGFWEYYSGTGARTAVTEEAFSGSSSMKVTLLGSSGQDVDMAHAGQEVDLTPHWDASNPRWLQARAWVKTATPQYAWLIMQQTNAGDHQFWHVGELNLSALTPNQWQQVTVEGSPFADSTEVAVVLRARKSLAEWNSDPDPVNIYFDDVEFGFQGLRNLDFEQGTADWLLWQRHENTGTQSVVTDDVHGGAQSLSLTLSQPSGEPEDTVQTSQRFHALPNRRLQAIAWVKTNAPAYGQFFLRQTNAGLHENESISGEATDPALQPYFDGKLTALAAGSWQGISVGGWTFEDTEEVALVFRVHKTAADWSSDPAPAEIIIDDIAVHDTTYYSPPASGVKTADHGFMVFETLLLSAKMGVSMANYHALQISRPSGAGGCGLFYDNVTLTPSGAAFQLAGYVVRHPSGTSNRTVVSETTDDSPIWEAPASPCESWACLAGGRSAPYVSSYVFQLFDGESAEPEEVVIFLLNRYQTDPVVASIDLSALSLNGFTKLSHTTLLAGDFTDDAFQAPPPVTSEGVFDSSVVVTLAPISMNRLVLRR